MAALPLKCAGVDDAIVSQVPAGFRCRSFRAVIDRIDSLWRRGAVALWLDQDGVAIESANESRGDRPWALHPRPKQPPPDPAGSHRGVEAGRPPCARRRQGVKTTDWSVSL